MADAVIHGIYSTPIKGCVLQPLRTPAFVSPSSFAGDRKYMIIAWRTDKGIWDFVTQRSFAGKGIARPRLSAVNARATGDDLILEVAADPDTNAGSTRLTTRIHAHGEPFPAMLWDDSQPVIEVSPDASAFFSELLNEPDDIGPFKLVTRCGNREARTRYGIFTNSCADKYPAHVVTVPSLTLLADRCNLSLDETRARFRPNLVLDGDFLPFTEDEWQHIRVGDTTFRVTSLTKRCGFVNIDAAGRNDTAHNLLGTLAKERRAQGHSGAPTFGLHLTAGTSTQLSVGMSVHCS